MIRILPAAGPELAEWFDAYPYHEYRRYRGLTRGQLAGFLQGLLLPRAGLGGSLTLVSRAAGKTNGALLCSPLDWDTRALETPSAKIDFLCSASAAAMPRRIRIKSALVGECLARASRAGTKFLSCRADRRRFFEPPGAGGKRVPVHGHRGDLCLRAGRTAAPALKEMFSVGPARRPTCAIWRGWHRRFSQKAASTWTAIFPQSSPKGFSASGWRKASGARIRCWCWRPESAPSKDLSPTDPDTVLQRAAGVRFWGTRPAGRGPAGQGRADPPDAGLLQGRRPPQGRLPGVRHAPDQRRGGSRLRFFWLEAGARAAHLSSLALNGKRRNGAMDYQGATQTVLVVDDDRDTAEW